MQNQKYEVRNEFEMRNVKREMSRNEKRKNAGNGKTDNGEMRNQNN